MPFIVITLSYVYGTAVMQNLNGQIVALIEKGVRIPNPESVEIGQEVEIDRISGDNVVFHAGTKIFGKNTLILQGARLGLESPTTVDNALVGPDVRLNGGYFKGAVFLEGVSFGLGGHVRDGTIMEEFSSTAHTVALKQTILMPFVTLGSLINFCDCLMAGGASRKNHSEVGSSYIHFNYTPNQDKATASLIGDVPRGVMLNQPPIFLGGQGGMVGPCRMEFGNVVAAGSIIRKDELRPERLIQEMPKKSINIPFTRGIHLTLRRIMVNNMSYIANLLALMQWYRQVRYLFVGNRFPQALLDGLCQTLQTNIDERTKRLVDYCRSMPLQDNLDSAQTIRQNELHHNGLRINDAVRSLQRDDTDDGLREPFLNEIQKRIQTEGDDYVGIIRSLPVTVSEAGTRWLQGIVNRAESRLTGVFPSL